MSECYLCGSHIPSGQGYRRKVKTGERRSVGAVRRPGYFRAGRYQVAARTSYSAGKANYYSLRTICRACVERQSKRRIGGAVLLIVAAIALAVFLISTQH